MSVQIVYPFFDWVFLFYTELNEPFVYFGEYPLTVASFANIFSHSVGCLFIFFMVFFAVRELLSLIRSHIFLFFFSLPYELDITVIYISVLPMFQVKISY